MAWSGWVNLGTPNGRPVTSTPAISSWGPNRIDVFVQGYDNALWHKIFENGQWSDWGSMGGILTSAPTAISRGQNLIDVYVRGNDNAMYYNNYVGGGWSGWGGLGGILTSGPAASSWGPNRVDVFVRGTDSAMWHIYWNGSYWSSWESLGGSFAPDIMPSAISRFENRIDVYGRGTDGVVKTKWWDGTRWSEWVNTNFSSVPAPTSRPPDWADWFWLDNNQHLRSTSCRGLNFLSMSNCSESDGGYYNNSSFSTVNTPGQNRIDLVMRYSDNSVWYNNWTPDLYNISPGLSSNG